MAHLQREEFQVFIDERVELADHGWLVAQLDRENDKAEEDRVDRADKVHVLLKPTRDEHRGADDAAGEEEETGKERKRLHGEQPALRRQILEQE